jgi:3-oxoisoapionate kinase
VTTTTEVPELSLPEGTLLAYAGDDFTGSTDVLQAVATAGLSAVLFLSTPPPEWLQRFKGVRCVGVATTARSQSPAWMNQHLNEVFTHLLSLKAPILHYKVCSTFDSSEHTGSIGRAIDIGAALMPELWSPMIVGAPRLKRYQAFGHLFAVVEEGAKAQGYRLDRHPTMSRHPVTPMLEADLRVHLGRQTTRRLELIAFTQLQAQGHAMLDQFAKPDQPVVLLDVMDEGTLRAAGALVWERRGAGIFSASSSGLPYALVAHWRDKGWIPAQFSLPVAEPVAVIAAVSGSCSPVAAAQIEWARDHGFSTLRLDVEAVLSAQRRDAEIQSLVTQALKAIAQQRSPLVYSALGPDDPSVLNFKATADQAGLTRDQAGEQVAKALAEIMRALLDQAPTVRRLVLAGGDSSGMIAQTLNIAALSVLSDLTPGAPLCRTWSDQPQRDGLEIVLKGGQMGAPTFYGDVLAGRSLRAT